MPTILIVDDDIAVAETVAESLLSEGFQVVKTNSTVEAMEKLDAGLGVDLCVVDLVMPTGVPDGLGFARTVTSRSPPLPVILMTGYYGFVARSGELPAKVLYKPIDMDCLVAEIGTALQA